VEVEKQVLCDPDYFKIYMQKKKYERAHFVTLQVKKHFIWKASAVY